MNIPQISDNSDQIVQLLTQIARNTGSLGENGDGNGPDVLIPRRPLSPGTYRVVESADMDWSNDDGTVTVPPGEEVPLVSYEFQAEQGMLLAVGATDAQNVTYRVEVDRNRTVGGRTQSPLGVLNNEFSFVETLGGAIPAASTFAYYARLDESASAAVDLTARLHLEEGSTA